MARGPWLVARGEKAANSRMLLLARTSLFALTTGTRALRGSSVPPRMAFQPPARIDAVVSDMDGTLFSFAGRGLSAGNIEALRGCMSNSVHVSLATGRIPGPWHTEVCEQLGPGLGPCVFGNGALVLDEEQRVIWEAQLPEEVISTVLGLTRGGTTAAGGRLCVLAATRWEQEPDAAYGGLRYCELSPDGGRSAITELIDRAGEPPAVVLPSLDGFEQRQLLKFVIWTLPGEDGWADMPSFVGELRTALAGTGATLLDHGTRWCEVLPPNVNKGTGVVRLLDRLGVKPEAVLACGDAENDVEMLALAGVGAAVANAQPAARAAADVLVASNADDGVAEAIKTYVWGGGAPGPRE